MKRINEDDKVTLTIAQLRDLVRRVKAGEVNEIDIDDMFDVDDDDGADERDRDYYNWLVVQGKSDPDEY